MSDTLFTKIIRGEIPSYKIYEDKHTFAFLDINPVQLGHILVVPKRQVATLWELDDANYHAVMTTVKLLADRLKQMLNAPYVGIKVEGLEVPHAHVHLIPFATAAEYNAKQQTDVSKETLTAIAEKLAI